MSWGWIVTFASGVLAGAVVVGTWLHARQSDHDRKVFEAGVREARAGMAPYRPVIDPPPRHPRERGVIHPGAVGVACVLAFLWAGFTVGGW